MVAGTLDVTFESNGAALVAVLESLNAKLAAAEVIGSKATNSIEHGFLSLLKGIVPVPPEIGKITSELGTMAGAGAAVLGVTAIIAGIGVAAIESGNEINEAFRTIIVKTGEEGAALQGLEADFKAVFSSVPGSAKEASEAIAQLHQRLGLTGEALQELAAQELDLAHITGADLSPQVAATSKLFNQWGSAIGSPTEALDFLFKVSQKTGIGVTQLSESLSRSGPILRALGIDFEKGAALIGSFDKAGLDSQRMMQGLQRSWSALVKSGQDPIKVFDDLIRKIQDSGTAMEANKLAMQAFGARGAAPMAEAIKSGRFEVENLIKALQESQSSIHKTEEETRTLGEWFRLLEQNVKLAIAPIGQGLIQALQGMAKSYQENLGGIKGAVQEFVKTFSDIWAGHGEQLAIITKLAWGVIASQIASTLTIINTALRTSIAFLSGDWSGFWNWMVSETEQGWKRVANALAKQATLGFGPDLFKIKEPASTGIPFTVTQPSVTGGGGGGNLGALAKQKGSDTAKAFIDGFKEGAAGLSKAVELIAGQSTAQLDHLMDPLSKGAKKNLAETQAALKAESTGINEWLSSIGAGAKLSEAQLAGSNKALRDELGASAVAWKNNQEIVNQWSLDLLRSTGVTVPQINAYLKSIGQESSITAAQLMNANQDTVKSLALAAKGFEDHSKSAAQDRQEVMLNYAEITKGELPLRDSAALFKLAAQGVLDHAHALESATAFSQPWVDAVNKQKDSLVQLAAAINSYLSKDPDFLRTKAQADAIAKLNADIKSVIDNYTIVGERAGLTGQKLVDSIVPKLKELGTEGEKAAIQLQKSFDRVSFDALSKKVNSAVNGIVEIFTLIPGEFGKVANEIQRTVNTIDKILGNLNKIFSNIPANLGGVIAEITKMFKGMTAAVTDSMKGTAETIDKEWADSVGVITSAADNMKQIGTTINGVGSSVQAGAGRVLAGLGSIAAGVMAFVGIQQSHTGVAGGIIQGALAGVAVVGGVASLLHASLAGLLFGGPWGAVAIGAGALIGGLISAFTGKSQAQKDAEARAAEQAKMSLQQSAQAVINSAIQGFDSALAFFDHLDEFTAPRKAKFAEFWKAMNRLMDGFVALAKTWAGASLEQAKQVADSIGPIAAAISALPEAFTAIAGHFSVADSSFDSFFADLDKLMTRFFARSEQWIDGISKRAMKVADRLAPVAGLISPLVQGFKDLGSFTSPSDAMFDALDVALGTLVTRMDALTGKWEKSVLKSIANFAEKIGPAVDLWKNAIETFKSMTDIPTPSVADFNAIFYGIEQAINGMIALAGRVSTDGLARADAIATASLVIFSTIKAAVEALAGLRDYVKIPSETFAALIEDFQLAVNLMVDGLAVSERFIGIAKTFEANIIEGAKHLANAVAIFTASIKNLGYGLAAFGVTVTLPGGDVGTTSTSSGGGFAPSSRTGSGGFAPSVAASGGTVNHYHFGDITYSGSDPAVARAVETLANLFGMNTGVSARLQQG